MFGKGIPAFGKAATEGFGKKGGAPAPKAGLRARGGQAGRQEGGALDAAWTVLEAATDFKDEATADACRRVIEATSKGNTPSPSDLSVINNYFG
jgi:hypothetical protein